jgi:hypothetical protein
MIDPFSDPGGGLQRDQWDRPIILRPWEEPGPCQEADGKRWNCHITKPHGHYQRASTFAGTLDDGPGLAIWMKRHVALAVATQPDLAAIISGMSYADGRKLDERIEEALTRNASREPSLQAANWGTAVHRFTEPDSPPDVPAELIPDVQSFHRALDTEGLEIVDTEVFVVNDRWRAAGTFDHRVRDLRTGRIHVLDKKTGKDEHPLSWAIQLVTYALGKRYNEDSGDRVDFEQATDTRSAFIAHIPLGTGACEIIRYDMTMARPTADLAVQVRIARTEQRDLRIPSRI